MLFDSEYAIYAEYLKSAIKLFKAGKKDGAFEMYMRNYLAPEVLPDELPQEKVEEACKNIFDEEVSEVEITLDMLQRGLDGWYAEAKNFLSVSSLWLLARNTSRRNLCRTYLMRSSRMQIVMAQ